MGGPGVGTLVVLAAGAGRRFGGCKQLVPVGPDGAAIMDYTLYHARSADFRRAVVVTRADLLDAMEAHFSTGFLGPGGCAPFPVELAEQPAGSAGTVPAVLAARACLAGEDVFGVANADDLYPLDALRALAHWEGPGHAVVGFHLSQTMLSASGVVNRALCRVQRSEGDGRWRLIGLVEASLTERAPAPVGQASTWRTLAPAGQASTWRPPAGHWAARERGAVGEVPVAGTQLVSMNMWALRSSIWPDLERAVASEMQAAGGTPGHREVLLPVVVGDLVANRRSEVTVLPVAGRCVGVTWPGELAMVRALVAERVAAGELPAPMAVRGASKPS